MIIKRVMSLCFLCIFGTVSTLSTAASNTELEAQVKAIQERLDKSEAAAAASAKKLKKLKKKTSKKFLKLGDRLDGMTQRLKINGFATASLVTSDAESDHLSITHGIQDKPSGLPYSRLGIQMDFFINDEFNFVVQLLSEGRSYWNTYANWSYLKYKPTADWTLRAGKLRIPYYLMSEYIDVGYAIPWARTPTEIYSVYLSNFTGFDVEWQYTKGDLQNSIKVFYGTTAESVTAIDYEGNNFVGIEDRVTFGYWTARIALTTAKFDLVLTNEAAQTQGALLTTLGVPVGYGFDLNKADFAYNSIGIAYDNEKLFINTEAIQTELQGILADAEAIYFSVGYRFGPWVPSIIVSKTNSTDDEYRRTIAVIPLNTLFDVAEESASIHLRYNVNSNVALKLAVEHNNPLRGSSGLLSDPEDSYEVYLFTVDALF